MFVATVIQVRAMRRQAARTIRDACKKESSYIDSVNAPLAFFVFAHDGRRAIGRGGGTKKWVKEHNGPGKMCR